MMRLDFRLPPGNRRKSMSVWWSVLSLLLVVSSVSASLSRSHVTYDGLTGGYKEVSVILDPQLDKQECPQILANVKVRNGPKKRKKAKYYFSAKIDAVIL